MTETAEVYAERRERWAAAVESGEYKFCKFALRKDDCFCATGIGCDLFIEQHPDLAAWGTNRENHWGVYVNDDFCSGYPPMVVLDWFGITPQQSAKLVHLNDTNASPAGLAIAIRALK